jgi:hypothetical protein
MIETHGVDESEVRHTVRVLDGARLRHSTAEPVADDACLVDTELVEDLDESVGVRARVDGTVERAIASSKAEEVEHHDAVARGHERNDVVPELARRRVAVDEHDRNASNARSVSVVLEPGAGHVEEFTAHACERIALLGN